MPRITREVMDEFIQTMEQSIGELVGLRDKMHEWVATDGSEMDGALTTVDPAIDHDAVFTAYLSRLRTEAIRQTDALRAHLVTLPV